MENSCQFFVSVKRKIAVPKTVTSLDDAASFRDFTIDFEPEVKCEVKEEPQEHREETCVIQTYIKQEPLDIKQEVMEEDPLAFTPQNHSALMQLSKVSNMNQSCDPALAQLNEIEKSNKIQRTRRSRAMIVAKSLRSSTKPAETVINKDKKHIMCFVCFDKFSSNLTFEMHTKLMHKDVHNS